MPAKKAASERQWETRHYISFPMPPSDAPELSVREVQDIIDRVRDERSDRAAGLGSATRS